MSDTVQHRTNKYLNNRLEQDHRNIKQRSYPMHGFGTFASAARFCRAFDELRQYFRPRHTIGKTWSLAEQRRVFCKRFTTLKELMVAIS
jgi:putative transposase